MQRYAASSGRTAAIPINDDRRASKPPRTNKNFYTVPTKYIGSKVTLMYDSAHIHVYSQTNELITVHDRS